MHWLIIASVIGIWPTSASATMPMLTDMPSHRTSAACKKWAASQDDDAIEMWGIQENGLSSRDIALRRLYLSCLGHRPPEIVGFGSSVGFDEAYCRKHPKFEICKDYAEDRTNSATRAEAKPDTCFAFGDDQQVTVRGDIVQSATTEESEGEPPHKYMAIMLDNPICFTGDLREKIAFIEVFPVSMKWLGHHVAITGNMTAGDSWSISVHRIEDVEP